MRVVVVVVVEGRRGLGETGMLNKRNRIEHLRGTNLGVAQPRPQDSPMFYKKKNKPNGQDWTCLRPIKEIILQHRRHLLFLFRNLPT